MAHNAYTFRYRVRNWHRYNQALIARGGINFWIDEAALAAWRSTQPLLGYGYSLYGGRQELVLPQPAGRSGLRVLGDESHETRPAGAEL